MKNIKKLLALALALVLAIGMVPVAGASSTGFPDADEIKNIEAAEVLSAIGIMEGFNDGTYRPGANLTRAQAAKIITCLVIGKNAAAALETTRTATEFRDVSSNHWASGLISYCTSQGYISGVGNNRYEPDRNVTASEFATMLLRVLGYGKEGEYTGSGWQARAIGDGMSVGILEGNTDFTAPATRDEAALYAFNALTDIKAFLVVYSKDRDAYEPGTPMQWLDTKNFPELIRGPGVRDDFGRPSVDWAFQGRLIGTYANKPTFVFTDGAVPGTMPATLRGYTFATTSSFIHYENGVSNTTPTSIADIYGEIEGVTGNGVRVEIYANESSRTITDYIVIKSDITEVTAISSTLKTVTLSALTGSDATGTGEKAYTIGELDPLYDSVKDLALGDLVMVTPLYIPSLLQYGAAAISMPTNVTGIIAAKNSYGWLTVSGKPYVPATVAAATVSAAGANPNNEAVLTLDAYGYVVNVDISVPASIDFIMVKRAYLGVANNEASQMVQGVLTDGTEVDVPYALVSGTMAAGQAYKVVSTVGGFYVLDALGAVLGNAGSGNAASKTAIDLSSAMTSATNTSLNQVATSTAITYTNPFASDVKFIYFSMANGIYIGHSIRTGVQTHGSSSPLAPGSVAFVEQRFIGGTNVNVVTAVFIPAAAPLAPEPNQLLFFPASSTNGNTVNLGTPLTAQPLYTAYQNGESLMTEGFAGIPLAAGSSISAGAGFYTFALDPNGFYAPASYGGTAAAMPVSGRATSPLDSSYIVVNGTTTVRITAATVIGDTRSYLETLYAPIDRTAAGIRKAIATDDLDLRVHALYNTSTGVASLIYITSSGFGPVVPITHINLISNMASATALTPLATPDVTHATPASAAFTVEWTLATDSSLDPLLDDGIATYTAILTANPGFSFLGFNKAVGVLGFDASLDDDTGITWDAIVLDAGTKLEIWVEYNNE